MCCSKQVKRIMAAASGVTYAEPGYLLFERDQKLVAQRFDLSRLELTGEPVPIGEPPLAQASWDATWIATASATGRPPASAAGRRRPRSSGRSIGACFPQLPFAGRWMGMAFSDEQSALASRQVAATLSEIWLFDEVQRLRGTPPQIANADVVWAPDGELVFSSSQGVA
jgi:hypothetical protein